MPKTKRKWIHIAADDIEWEGPYQCEECGEHVMLAATFLDQVSLSTKCPYCGKVSEVPKEEELISVDAVLWKLSPAL